MSPIGSMAQYINEIVLLLVANALVRAGTMKMFQLVNLYNYFNLFMSNAFMISAVWQGFKMSHGASTTIAKLADKVYLFTPYADCGVERENVVVNPGRLKEVTGEDRVSGVVLTDGTEIELSGVFVLRNAVAPGTLLRGLEIEGSDIVVDRRMATNKPGCFAAGDCTGRPYQLAKAVGEGNVAAHSIVEYLAALEK